MTDYVSPRQMYLAQKRLKDEMKKIPKKNKRKFSVDLIKLISLAQQDDYDNYNL